MTKRILSLIICICVLFGGVLSVAATSVDEIKQKQQELEEQSAQYEAILNEKNAEVEKQQEYVDALVGKVQTVSQEIAVSHEKIAALDEKIDQKKAEIKQANDDIEKNMNILRQRIKTIYIAGDVSSLEIILGAKDFTDFLDKVQLVKSVSNHDEELINEIKAQLEEISAEKEALQVDKLAVEEEEKNLKVKQDELNKLLDENKETLATLQEASNEAKQQLMLTEEQISQLSDELQEYYRQQQAAQQESNGSTTTPASTTPIVSVPSNGGWVWPCPGYTYLSSEYGEWRGYSHSGIDIAGGGIMGAPAVAAASGTVVGVCSSCYHNWGKDYSCGCGGGYGNYVWVSHGNGKETIYAHLSSVAVSVGQSVSAGQIVGYVGSTGHSTGAHLHFECRYNGMRYNPLSEY